MTVSLIKSYLKMLEFIMNEFIMNKIKKYVTRSLRQVLVKIYNTYFLVVYGTLIKLPTIFQG